MRVVAVPASIVLVSALAAAAPAAAQSLADVARREATRRATLSGSVKVYTNDDLTPDPTTPRDGAAGRTPGAGPAGTAAPETAGAADDAPSGSATADDEPYHIIERPDDRGEEYWRGRATRIQRQLTRARTEADGFEARLASLPPGTPDEEREAAEAAAARARRDVASLEAEWTRFEAAARAAGVPLAWIR